MLAGPPLATLALAWGDEHAGPPIDPDAALPIASESSCLAAIVAALEATGAFDAVYCGLTRDARDRPADELATAIVEPGSATSFALGDDGPDGLTVYDATAVVVVSVRDDDDDERDAAVRKLTSIVRNALGGLKLARGCCPDWSRVSAWQTLPAGDVDRAASATFGYRWLEEGYAAADLA